MRTIIVVIATQHWIDILTSFCFLLQYLLLTYNDLTARDGIIVVEGNNPVLEVKSLYLTLHDIFN